MKHRRKWNHMHPTRISINYGSGLFPKHGTFIYANVLGKGTKKNTYTRSWNDAIRAYGWRCVKATLILGQWLNMGLFGLLNVSREDVGDFWLRSARSVFRITRPHTGSKKMMAIVASAWTSTLSRSDKLASRSDLHVPRGKGSGTRRTEDSKFYSRSQRFIYSENFQYSCQEQDTRSTS